jgi:hypothetical protein
MKVLPSEPYVEQVPRWPEEGKHILAHYDRDTIVVYQAYRASIGKYAIANAAFGGDFSYSRMSWIKPNFLWMMFRSGWGTKQDQEFILGLRLRRQFFDALLACAVNSNWQASDQITHEEWKVAVANSDVRLQWDPDHDPYGKPLSRRAIQLGLRGAALDAFGRRELLDVIDLTAFVAEQTSHVRQAQLSRLKIPVERIYIPHDASIARHLKLDWVSFCEPKEKPEDQTGKDR